MTIEKGKQYEHLGCLYLEQRGWRILVQNYYSRHGEIDIICVKEEELCFVEVKGRGRQTSWNDEIISPSKRRKIQQTAEIYLASTDIQFSAVQFAVLWIEGESFQLMEHAFDADEEG